MVDSTGFGVRGVDSHEDRAGSACSCGGQLQSRHTSPQRRADWPVLCTAGCREGRREWWCCYLVFSISSGTINHLVLALSKWKSTNTHFRRNHATWQNNEKRLQSRETHSLSLFLWTRMKWNYYVWAKKNKKKHEIIFKNFNILLKKGYSWQWKVFLGRENCWCGFHLFFLRTYKVILLFCVF